VERTLEPITAIVTALALGAAAGIKDVAKSAVKDGYSSLKKLVKARYTHVDVDLLEKDPKSKARRKVVEEDLAKTGAAKDRELLDAAHRLLRLVLENEPSMAGVIGVDLKHVETASLSISDVVASGAGVKLQHVESGGDINISKVRAGFEVEPISRKKK
jgi:hypothetical protein